MIFNIYNFLSTNYENFNYLDKNSIKENTNLLNDGFEIILGNNEIKKFEYYSETINVNNYLRKLIIQEDQIDDLISEFFFNNNLASKITRKTGFNYRIDFFTAYETFNIPLEMREKKIYANHWHKDKPYSKNTLKVIIPIEKITIDHGGIEIIDKYQTKMIEKKQIGFKDAKKIKMSMNLNEILLFLPNVCWHKAGNPTENLSRKQIMFQLNPSKKWCYKKNLYSLQKSREPKFPLLKFNKNINYL